MKKLTLTLVFAAITMVVSAQTQLKKVYDETVNPIEQIDKALDTVKSQQEKKFIICQVGGNWCPWCLRFADFIGKDADIMKVVNDNATAEALMKRLGNPQRFGFPVFVVLDKNGKVLHIQDSSFLEEGQGYNKNKVLRFLNNWTPKAVNK